MKKNSVLLALIGLAMFTLCGCKPTVTGKDGQEYTSYQEACRAGDFEAALIFVDKLEQETVERDKYDRYIPENIERYTSARDYVFYAEVQLLMADGSQEASDRIIFLLNSLPQKGTKLPEGHEGTDARTTICDGSSFNKDFAWFCETIYSYNDKCRQIMELCINQKNKYLAEKIVKLVKKRPTSSEVETYEYVVNYTDEDIDAIKKMFDDAVAAGDFD